jgi:hypothetical protein
VAASSIDDVVAALSGAGADLSSPVKSGHAGIIYSSADDSFTQTTAAPATGMTPEPLFDDGRDLQASANAIVAEFDKLVSRLNAGTHDAQTGQKTYDVTGREREVLQRQIEQLRISGEYSFNRLDAIAAQRVKNGGTVEDASVRSMVQMADGSTTTLAEAAARMAFIDSAPPGQRAQFAADYDRAMREANTRNVADAVRATRRR